MARPIASAERNDPPTDGNATPRELTITPKKANAGHRQFGRHIDCAASVDHVTTPAGTRSVAHGGVARNGRHR